MSIYTTTNIRKSYKRTFQLFAFSAKNGKSVDDWEALEIAVRDAKKFLKLCKSIYSYRELHKGASVSDLITHLIQEKLIQPK